MTWKSSQGSSDRLSTTPQRTVGAHKEVADRSAGRNGRQGAEGQRLIIASNRGPVNFTVNPETGTFEAQPGAGGVVSGLLSATTQRPVTWIALAMSDADRAIARAHEGGEGHAVRDFPNISLRLVETTEEAYTRYYDGVSNKALWFIQHYLLQPTTHPLPPTVARDWDEGYRVVNDAVAQTVIDELEASGYDTPVMFQDYHLYLAPGIVRERLPWARLTHFIHIPWPEARYWELAPEKMTRGIFAGLAANDIIGFQTERDARNFLDGALRFLPDVAEADETQDDNEAGALLVDGRRVSARVYPIAVTPAEVFAQARGELDDETAELLARARPTPDHKLILRVDRVEPTKNIVAGFRAYERLLQEHARLRERVTFLALLVPSREGLAEYRAVMRETKHIIDRINNHYGTATWKPIIAVFGNNRTRALACMREFDTLLVNPLLDGMNLVVKEGALVNERAGALVLSRTAGAYERLGQYTLGVPPTDIEAMSDALYQALTMSPRDRRARATGLLNILLQESSAAWLQAQLHDLAAQTGRPQVVYRTADALSVSPLNRPAPRPAAASGGRADAPTPSVMRSAADMLSRETLMASRHATITQASMSSEGSASARLT
ncbi:MAG TPA: trehalose-6-phosphate synthase [Ktedonobacterales bacterium]|nr:trehalose-6-phosphate synthase [Ktedonobacterales bacterium]